ncbi:ATP-dependent protease la [Chrysochromulina tobinii]|uniref:endopeptidase La n=1 Tax=Chrysochromulina tobinii TaxID=1460289 RepID=A0A0M0JXY4_9EUKA|nr:ATP-dependent protease la [Chrysochromulina tobinii]|eukprot:KOO31430.1 ATP-dependent protease la [Chrysochromulina sp. CCMP291]
MISLIRYSTLVDYLEFIADLPWNATSAERLQIAGARKQLEADHFGMDKVKARVLEYLAVAKLKGDMRGSILCMLGPPGIGKTSLGKSIADALHRDFYRVSLGGVHSEAEIRGHRRTYVGAMPGLILQALKKCGSSNCVIMLDEIDKLGRNSLNGDPSSALLEVLDPEQNQAFRDHYLNLPFNLSKVLFIATANELDPIPRPLYDRMEVLEMSGYTVEEKVQIALRHLLPKQRQYHGLADEQLRMDVTVVDSLISKYTREAGVRELDRQLAALCRSVAARAAEAQEAQAEAEARAKESAVSGEAGAVSGTAVNAKESAYDGPRDNAFRLTKPGIVAGLAYTSVGGDLLYVEAEQMAGRGEIVLTGQLGDVMKESAMAARSWIRAHAHELGLVGAEPGAVSGGPLGHFLNSTDLHIHFPAGAVPKDGPSAGVTITTAIVSLLTGRKVRPDLAMTGEVTLRGLVLPVGGIKEKVIAAHRGGMRTVILPAKNEKDLRELPQTVLRDMTFILVREIREVLDAALLPADAKDSAAQGADTRL